MFAAYRQDREPGRASVARTAECPPAGRSECGAGPDRLSHLSGGQRSRDPQRFPEGSRRGADQGPTLNSHGQDVNGDPQRVAEPGRGLRRHPHDAQQLVRVPVRTGIKLLIEGG